ncbi:hypothetical protein QZH44_29920 (plasmid) [Pseudomonas corrugata]|uniref:hypothetical protein n=1 Tax=Pseudomonas corrugata TaxID=47879 RepID=UPI003D813702
MAEHFDPEKIYALNYDGVRLGVVRKGLFYEGPEAWQVGEIYEGTFYYNGKAAGTVEGLTLTRTEPKPTTMLHLVALEE